MKPYTDYVNVFQGACKVDLPKPEGIAATWLFIKSQCGNTTPAAAYPFGKTSLCAYTGGYPTGYGNYCPNSQGEPPTFDAKVHGFSHMHASGTGGIRVYYNFALTSPLHGNELRPQNDLITKEIASPGYYAANLSSGIEFEGTVTKELACHRYHLQEDGLLQIDFSNSGLDRRFGKNFFDLPTDAKVTILSPTRVTAKVRFRGIDLYFAAECLQANGVILWQDYKTCQDLEMIPSLSERFGAAFHVSGTAEMRLSISFVSHENAIAMLDQDQRSFDRIREDSLQVWNSYLGRISIQTQDERLLEVFYSNLYHSLIKPCSGCGESYLYRAEEADGQFYFDFATLWDLYKTELPLIFTLYPNEAQGIAETLLQLIERFGRSPINVTLSENNDFTDQARMLAEHSLADFYFRGGESFAERILNAAEADLKTHTDFLEHGICKRYTHVLDLCEALGAMTQIAKELHYDALAKRFEELSARWINVYDNNTGLLSQSSPYYEGTYQNYSFRLLRNMQDRIAIAGKDKFLQDLDALFGYTREAVERPIRYDVDPLTFGIESFEGFNNESDMEMPYAYLYADRHDKTCEVLRAGMKYMFTTGRGGLPGNNDSGGLSSFYVWNALGLFPVSGQDLVLIGSPLVDGASLILANGKHLHICVVGNSDNSIYVRKVFFNGNEVKDYRLSARELMHGGLLEIEMMI